MKQKFTVKPSRPITASTYVVRILHELDSPRGGLPSVGEELFEVDSTDEQSAIADAVTEWGRPYEVAEIVPEGWDMPEQEYELPFQDRYIGSADELSNSDVDSYTVEVQYYDMVEYDSYSSLEDAIKAAKRQYRTDSEVENALVFDTATDELLFDASSSDSDDVMAARGRATYAITWYNSDGTEEGDSGFTSKIEVMQWAHDILNNKPGVVRVVVTKEYNGKSSVFYDSAASNKDANGFQDYEIHQDMWGYDQGKIINKTYRAKSAKEAVEAFMADTGEDCSGLFAVPVGQPTISDSEYDAYYDDMYPSRPIELSTAIKASYSIVDGDDRSIVHETGFATLREAVDYAKTVVNDGLCIVIDDATGNIAWSAMRYDLDRPVGVIASTDTQNRISDLEQRIAEIKAELADPNIDADRSVDLQLDLQELEEQLNFAWQDDEAEYNYAVEQQEFNPDGSLRGYGDTYGCTSVTAAEGDSYEDRNYQRLYNGEDPVDEPEHKGTTFWLITAYHDGLDEVEDERRFTSSDEAEAAGLEILENDSDADYVTMMMDSFGSPHFNMTVKRPEERTDSWDTFDGKKFLVMASHTNQFGELEDTPKRIATNDPMTALEGWFKWSPDFPTETSIFVKTKADGVIICKTASAEVCTELYEKYPGNPYELNYLIEGAEKKVADGCKGIYESDYGDQVYPFCYG